MEEMDKIMKNVTEKSLTTRQQQALVMIITGRSVADAAKAANVKRQTVYTWLNQPNFRQVMEKEKTELLERISLSLTSLGDKAIKALDQALEDPNISVRLRAADIYFSQSRAYKDQVELGARINALEDAVTQYQSDRRKL